MEHIFRPLRRQAGSPRRAQRAAAEAQWWSIPRPPLVTGVPARPVGTTPGRV
ncbi:hypothetical protein [Actinoalloteichus hymeniacidonis]|uniref:hypothetical protein n=1 Tax=Actinoalloteichus hymeniacidonis TaxID=340345 RepID=UPI0012FA83BB|nr:hypothetical protein [Actinoalloteichus hymeniacidonis]MBB5908491.1 hypothetical protein [Actinoalloteichus hymeniacidonis]